MTHPFEASYSGMCCQKMVMRGGGGDACGEPPDAPIHDSSRHAGQRQPHRSGRRNLVTHRLALLVGGPHDGKTTWITHPRPELLLANPILTDLAHVADEGRTIPPPAIHRYEHLPIGDGLTTIVSLYTWKGRVG